MKLFFMAGLAGAIICTSLGAVWAAEADPMKPRVPEDQRAAAKKLTSPVKMTEGVVSEGKQLFEGKGACFNCHGKSGKGDGPVGATLNPAPRDLTNCEFQKKRAEGELFWIIKNGSPGTAMVPLVPPLTEEEAWKIIAYVRSFCK